MKTMTTAQLTWAIRKGFAWPDQANDRDECGSGLGDVFWTKEGGYMWNVGRQLYEMVI